MHDKLIQELKKYNPAFSPDEIEMGLDLFEEKTFKAHELVSKIGEVCEYLIFAEDSITRCFYLDAEGQEQTLWMKPKQTFLTEY
ncbi:MAG: hypothetical protein AAF696_29370 [Bacteroidota bacterium]